MMLTIFTPTYNRAALLPRVYESLLRQSDRDFEWLIVDDGSTDGTKEVVERMMAEGRMEIVYHRKDNGGKHTAHNAAVELARGDWFLCVDSDDMLAHDAVAHVTKAICHLSERDCCLAAHKEDRGTGHWLGTPFPEGDRERCGMYGWNCQGAAGEYALAFKTSVLKQFLFPVIPGERFVGECVLYDRMELAGYTVCPLNDVLEVCEYQPDGLSDRFYRLMLSNPVGYQIYHGQRIDLVRSLKERMGHCIRYQAFRRMKRDDHYRYAGPHRGLTALMWLPGAVGAMYYKSKAKQKESRRMEQ